MRDTSPTLIPRILEASTRVSQYSVAAKPFIRLQQDPAQTFRMRQWWDFDDLLNKRLLTLLTRLASPDEIASLNVAVWRKNLERLEKEQTAYIEYCLHHHKTVRRRDGSVRTSHLESLARNLTPGSTILYIGSGTGPSPEWMARRGFHAVGIDPILSLVTLAQRWKDILGVPSLYYACMDGTNPGFKANAFDAVITVYGFLPTQAQITQFQMNLARLIKPDGLGQIMAMRKQYPSYFYLMGSTFPPMMAHWLSAQALLDFFFTSRDAHEQKLLWGLYQQTHTVQSLTHELQPVFNVLSCSYDGDDPRYISALVKPKNGYDKPTPFAEPDDFTSGDTVTTSEWIISQLNTIESLCDLLEDHANRLVEYFEQSASPSLDVIFQTLRPDLDRLVTQLETVFYQR